MGELKRVKKEASAKPPILLGSFGHDLIYGVSTAISSSAFFVYAKGLGEIHWTIGLFWISFISLLVVKFAYPVIERQVFKHSSKMPLLEAVRSQPFALPLLAIVGFVPYACMLPLLKSQEAAMLFLIASCFCSVLAIPLAKYVFNDGFKNATRFWIGFLILCLGTFVFRAGGAKFGNSSLLIFCAAAITTGSNLVFACLERLITSEPNQRIRFPNFRFVCRSHIPVKTAKLFVSLAQCFLALGIALISDRVFHSDAISSMFNWSSTEARSLIWIGVVVTLSVAICRRANNAIGDTRAAAIAGIRPLIGILFITPIACAVTLLPPETWETYQIAGAIIASGGTLICLLAKPFSATYGRPIENS